MKKVISLILVVVLLALPMTAHAATPRMIGPIMELSFNGTTAICEVYVAGDSGTDDIQISVRLWRGSTICNATWGASGTGEVEFYKTKEVVAGYTYTLSVDVVINGVIYPRQYTSASC